MQSGTLFCPWARGGAFRHVAKQTAKLFGCPEFVNAQDCSASKNEMNCVQDDGEIALSEALLDCLQGVDAKNLTSLLLDHAVRRNLLP